MIAQPENTPPRSHEETASKNILFGTNSAQENDLLEYCPSMVCALAISLALTNPGISIHEEECQRKHSGVLVSN